jgi:hypothetical protein
MGAVVGTPQLEVSAKEPFSPVVPGLKANTSTRSKTSVTSEFSLTEGQLKRDAIADSELECSQITKYLFIGGQRVAENLELLLEKKITRIINCASSVVPNYHQGFGNMKYLSLNLVDGSKEDISWFVCEVIQFIYEGAQKKERVLLHCEKGISRSCAFGIAYRMWSTGETYRAAFSFISTRRTVCDPKPAFICNLTEIGEIFFGSQVETSLLFRCSYHAAYDHLTPVLKLCRNITKSSREVIVPSTSLLNPKGVFVLRAVRSNKHYLFLWKGRNATPTTRQQAFRLTSLMARIFSNASSINIIEEGNESEEFLSFLIADGPFKSREDTPWEDYFDFPPSPLQIEAATSADVTPRPMSRTGNNNNNNDDGNTPKNSTTPKGSFRVKPVVYGQVNVQGKPLSQGNSLRSVSRDNNNDSPMTPPTPAMRGKEIADRISNLISGDNSLRLKTVGSLEATSTPSPIPLPVEETVIANNNYNNNVVVVPKPINKSSSKADEVRESSSTAAVNSTSPIEVVNNDNRRKEAIVPLNLSIPSTANTTSTTLTKKTEMPKLALALPQTLSSPQLPQQQQQQQLEVPQLKPVVVPSPQRNFSLALPLQQPQLQLQLQPQQPQQVVPQFQLSLTQLEQQPPTAGRGERGGKPSMSSNSSFDQLKLPVLLNRNGSNEKLPSSSTLPTLHTPTKKISSPTNNNNSSNNTQIRLSFHSDHDQNNVEQQQPHSYSRNSSYNRLEPVSSASELLKQSTGGVSVPLTPSRPASAERRSFSFGVSHRMNVGTSASATGSPMKNNPTIFEEKPPIPALSLLPPSSANPPMKENNPPLINSERPPALKRDEFRDTETPVEKEFSKPLLYQLSRKSEEEDDEPLGGTSAEHYEWVSLFDYEYDDLQNVSCHFFHFLRILPSFSHLE